MGDNKKIKIAYIIDTIATPSAGTEKQLLLLLDELDKSKFEPFLFCLKESDWLKNNSINAETYFLQVNSLKKYCSKFFEFKKIHKNQKFDIVQTFFTEGNIFGTIAAKIAGCKIIISSRRNIGYWHNKNHIRLLKFLHKWTTAYICNSKAASEVTIEVEHADRKKMHVIYNGLCLDKFKSLDNIKRDSQRELWKIKPDEILIGTVANLRPVKNISLLVETASRLQGEFKNLKFVVIGEGEGKMQDTLQQQIDSLYLTDKFMLVGRIDDVTGPLAAFDIAVIPSLSESFSNSLIEYMAAKLPIVASDAGGNVEALVHNETGLLYSNNKKNGLYNCLREIILDKSRFVAIAEKAQDEAFSKYNVTKMIQNHQDFYINLLRESNEKNN